MRAMELREYQREAVKFGLDAGRWVLALPPGSGKSFTTASWLYNGWLNDGQPQRTLLVAPLQVQGHWRETLQAAWSVAEVVDGTGTAKQRQRARDAAREANRGPLVMLLNYEAMRQDIDELIGLKFDTFVADEAHRLKGRGTQQSKAAAKIARRAERVCLITGTPVMNRADELWSLLHLLDPKTYTSFWRWAKEHFEIETPNYGWSLKPVMKVGALLEGHEALLREETRGRLLQRPMEDLIPDLPPVIETVLPVELSPAERKAYDTLIDKGWMQTPDEDVIVTPNAVSKMTRSRQIASDWGSINDALSHGSKVKATVSLVRDLLDEGHQVVVLTEYREAAQRIAGEFAAALYIGGMGAFDKEVQLQLFQAGVANVFVGTIAAVGEGTDGLQVASHLVLHDRSWVPARNQQAIARLARSGQGADVVHVYHVTAANTVDDQIAKALAAKEDVIAALDLAAA
jgi:SNF2 family DNA or RNA helicase